jgi:ABC-2 type transport system ATP-binding protein
VESVIRLDEVTKRYGSQTALDRVSLEVPSGVVFALLGENGAGKTTVIRILLGLARADAGQAEVLGMSSARQGLEIRALVGYVPERPTLYDWMTVAEIGWFTAGFYGDGFLAEYLRLAEQFGLPARRKCQALSKGMRAKVSLALALAHDPALLVLDEPTSGLDTMVRHEFLASMVDRAGAGKTVLLSSHQIHEVERVADIVAILHAGRLLLVERLEDLKAQTRELTVTLHDGVSPDIPWPGEVLSQCRSDRQWRVLLRGSSEDAWLALRGHPAVRDLDVRTPSLEQIFVAYLRREPAAAQAGDRKEAPLP